MSLVPLHHGSGKNPARNAVFLVHGVGGTVLAYRPLALRLGGRSCLGIEAHGLDGQEPPLDCVEALAARYIDEIQLPYRPSHWLLAGWSFGGVVAFEMSVQLARAGERVSVALLDARGLSKGRATSGKDGGTATAIANEDGGAGARGALSAVRAISQAHAKALGSYRPGRTTAPLLVIRAAEEGADAEGADAEGADAEGADADITLGFGGLAEGFFDARTLLASHDSLLAPPAVDTVARWLDAFFGRWDGP